MLQAVISVLSKLSTNEPKKWFMYIQVVQDIQNSTTACAKKYLHFEFLVITSMRHKQDSRVIELVQEKHINTSMDQSEILQAVTKDIIFILQEINIQIFSK